MKKIFLLGFILCVANSMGQQSFAPINTEWYYGVTLYPNASNLQYKTFDYDLLKSVGDTLIGKHKCNKIVLTRGRFLCIPIDKAYLYQSNDTVYYYNLGSSEFNTLYVFGAGKGDSWKIKYPAGDVTVTVDSVGSLQALGHLLKVQYVTYRTMINSNPPYPIQYSSTIVEGIGDLAYLFYFNIHERPTCDEWAINRTGLRCYINPSNGSYNIGNIECDFVSGILLSVEKQLRQYATPLHSLKVESFKDNISSITVMNANGQIFHEAQNIGCTSIEIPILVSGLIITVVTLERGGMSIGKIQM